MIIKWLVKYSKVIVMWSLAVGVTMRVVSPIRFAIYCNMLEYFDPIYYLKRIKDFGISSKNKKK